MTEQEKLIISAVTGMLDSTLWYMSFRNAADIVKKSSKILKSII
mgnify:CR=1 FL=1